MRIHFLKGRAPEVFRGKSLSCPKVGFREPKFGGLFVSCLGFCYFAGLSLVIGLPHLGVVPITNAVFSNARVSVLELCHGQISADFRRIHGPWIPDLGFFCGEQTIVSARRLSVSRYRCEGSFSERDSSCSLL